MVESGGIFKMDEVYRSYLRIYWHALKMSDAKVGSVEGELCSSFDLGTDGEMWRKSCSTRIFGVIDETFSWEAERGQGLRNIESCGEVLCERLVGKEA